jgi:hypothetical protein
MSVDRLRRARASPLHPTGAGGPRPLFFWLGEQGGGCRTVATSRAAPSLLTQQINDGPGAARPWWVQGEALAAGGDPTLTTR